MTTGRKVLIGIMVFFIIVIVGIGLFIRDLAVQGVPEYDGRLKLANLTAEVTVFRDEYAIPHIYAQTEEDLYRATGYVMAQDRLFQMDLIRRATTGRLSEIFGADLVDADHMLRALRIPDKSRMVMDSMDANVYAALVAFSDGMNQFIESNKEQLPLEFSVLGYVPEPWKPEHSLNLIGYMAWDLTMPWSIEVVLHSIRKKVGETRYNQLLPDLETQSSVAYPEFTGIPEGLEFSEMLVSKTQALEELGLTVFRGSNNWAVSGEKSITGKPLLANDMHLGFGIPGIWMQMHQVIEGELNVTGVILPGQPFIIAGHNDRIAWGMTNVMVDDMDFYLEKINPVNSRQYEFNGEWKDMDVRREVINVKGAEPVTRETKFTHRGPIVTGFKSEADPDEPISMRWIGNEYSNEVRTIYLLNRAGNWDEFRDAAKTFIAVSQNIAYADVDGNIGLYACAGVPIREGWNGVQLVPGETDQYDWKGLVPFEQLPHEFNPESGYVSSANNKSAADSASTVIPQWPSLHYRIDRIREMLEEKPSFSVSDIKRMHGDSHSRLVDELLPMFLENIELLDDLNTVETEALKLLQDWDGSYPRNSSAALIFEEFYNVLLEVVLADELGEVLFNKYIGTSYLSRFAINDISKQPGSRWWDDAGTDDKVETFTDCIQTSFRRAVSQLALKNGERAGNWRWGSAHTLTLEHPMGGVKILDRIFNLNRGPYETKGSAHTVGPYAYKYTNPYHVNHGASHRHIFDLSNWDKSLTVIPTGTSGVPASPHYCDQTELYLANGYHSDYVSRDLVEDFARYKMVLTP